MRSHVEEDHRHAEEIREAIAILERGPQKRRKPFLRAFAMVVGDGYKPDDLKERTLKKLRPLGGLLANTVLTVQQEEWSGESTEIILAWMGELENVPQAAKGRAAKLIARDDYLLQDFPLECAEFLSGVRGREAVEAMWKCLAYCFDHAPSEEEGLRVVELLKERLTT